MPLSPPPPQQQLKELLDPEASAGSLWRASRLEAFRDRAASAGLLPPLPPQPLAGDEKAAEGGAPEKTATDDGKKTAAAANEIALLLARAAKLSSELDDLACRQATGEARAPWWADGEYDDAAADAANDRGVEALRRWRREEEKKQKNGRKKSNASSFPSPSPSSSLFFAEQALALFTEAVRLRPSSAAYCANRARAALALAAAAGGTGRDGGFFELAAAAAGEAARADPSLPRAWSLRGRALSSLGRFGEAAASFERALELERGGREGGGKGGTEGTRRLLDAARASKAAAAALAASSSSGSSSRPALRRDTSASEFEKRQREAGEALEAAERALRAEPGRHELLRARAEVRKKSSNSFFFFSSSEP